MTPVNAETNTLPHPVAHHPTLLHHTPLTKMHRRQTASLQRRESDNRREGADSHSIPERPIGKCPVAVVKIGGVSVPCLLDSGSEVSTITEEFFNTHFKIEGTGTSFYQWMFKTDSSKWVGNTLSCVFWA